MQFKKKTLKNGLRIIVVPMQDNPTVTVLVLNATGSEYEPKELNGISHFLEHMSFKGTTNRPTARIIVEDLDGIGAQYNAFTGEEYTGYFARAQSERFGVILDVISDIFLNPTFPKEGIDTERGVIIGEIDMYEDDPSGVVEDVLTDLMYGDQPAGRTIIGPKKVIQSLSRDDFIAYKAKHYVAETTIVVVAGGVEEKQAFIEIENAFAEIPTQKRDFQRVTHENQKSPAIRIKYKKTDQSHILFGFHSYKIGNPCYLALSVLKGVLSGGMSSRLFQRIREELGLGYYISAGDTALLDHGFFAIQAGVANDRVGEAIEAILEEVKKIRDQKVSAEELRKVKNMLIGNMSLGLERSNDLAIYYGGLEITGRSLITPDEKEKEIEAITAKDIQSVAQDIFKNEKLNLAMIGPFKDSDKFKKLLHV